MNQLSTERRAAIVRALVEGNSARAAARLTGTSRATVLSLVVELGELCRVYQGHKLRNLKCQRIQCDEIWSFVGAKHKQVLSGAKGAGDVWTWTAMDPDSKLMVCWLVGQRSPAACREFIADLAGRLASRVQITTDGYTTYISAVENAFGWDGADFAQLVKIYASSGVTGEGSAAARRYSPAVCIGAEKHWVMGDPDPDHVSTSMVERSNLTMRMGMRRFTRLTQCLLSEGRKPRLFGGHSLHVLQLCPPPCHADQGPSLPLSHDSRDGCWHSWPCLDSGGPLRPFGPLQAVTMRIGHYQERTTS